MTYPWDLFSVELSQSPVSLWIMLGECQSVCQQIAGTALLPKLARGLNRLYLAKGIGATALLEGDMLPEEEALRQIERVERPQPPEGHTDPQVDILLTEYRKNHNLLSNGENLSLSADSIRRLNQAVSRRSSIDESENSRMEPPDEDSKNLLNDLCVWLDSEEFTPVEGMEIVCSVIRAVAAHYYLTRIHPFADRNGQTARLVEFQILTASSIPPCVSHALCHQYALTRTEYLDNRDHRSRLQHDALTGTEYHRRLNSQPIPFLAYAVRCLKAALEEILRTIRIEQTKVTWENHVAGVFSSAGRKEADRRRHDLVLDLSAMDSPIPLSGIRSLSARVASAYAKKTLRTLMRDLEALQEMKLVEKTPAGYCARREVVETFKTDRDFSLRSK